MNFVAASALKCNGDHGAVGDVEQRVKETSTVRLQLMNLCVDGEVSGFEASSAAARGL